MSEYDTLLPKSNGIISHPRPSFEEILAIPKPSDEFLSEVDIEHHLRRIMIKRDRPFGAIWNSQHNLCEIFNLLYTGDKALIANSILISAILAGIDGQCVGVSLNSNWYSRRKILRYPAVREILFDLTRRGLIVFYKVPQRNPNRYLGGVCSFFRVSRILISEVGYKVMTDGALEKSASTDIVTLRDKNHRLLKIPRTKRFLRCHEDLKAQNEFMRTVELSYSDNNVDSFCSRLRYTDQCKRCVFRGDKRKALAANLVTNTEPSAGLIQLSSKLTDFQIQKNKLLAYTLADIAVPQMSTNDQHKSDKKPAQVKYFSGTAFFIDKEHLVTNEHVVAGASNISIGFKGVRKTASLVSSNASDDIAILKLNTPFSYTSCFSLSNNAAIVPGTTVYAAGFPRSDVLSSDGKITDGIISSKNGMLDNPKTFQISTPVQSGNSGGPIFVQDGRLAGVVVAKLKDGENVNFGIKSAVAKMHVDLSGINPTCTNPLNRMTDFHSAIAIVNSEVYP